MSNVATLLELATDHVLDGRAFSTMEHNYFNPERIRTPGLKDSAVDLQFVEVLQKFLETDLYVSLTDLPLTFEGMLGQRNPSVEDIGSKEE